MTNQEAITQLKEINREAHIYSEAVDMAISALQAQKSPKPPAESVQNVQSEDLVSRKAAIDATWEEPHYADPLNVLTEVRDRIKSLPSAQPDGWLEQNKDKILQAGMEGREIDFHIGGRLFAIREKAQ